MEKHVAIIHKHGQLFTEEGDFPSICVRGPWKQLELSVWSQRVMSAHLQGGAEDKHRQGVWRKGLSESFSERSQGLVFRHCPLIINYLPFQRKYQVVFFCEERHSIRWNWRIMVWFPLNPKPLATSCSARLFFEVEGQRVGAFGS